MLFNIYQFFSFLKRIARNSFVITFHSKSIAVRYEENTVNNTDVLFIYFSVTDSQNLKAFVYGIKDGVTTNYPLENPNVCETHDIDCPVRMGKLYDLESALDVKKSYPAVCIMLHSVLGYF